MLPDDLVPFLIRAKTRTYAAGAAPVHSSRPGSHDLRYEEPPYLYIDTYLGGFAFIGEEAVWRHDMNIWGMNYYGKMVVEQIPVGFGEFLKHALMQVPAESPFRGPEQFTEGNYLYECSVTGNLEHYTGTECISRSGLVIYILDFHGGEISD